MTLKVKIIDSVSSNWYHGHKNCLFDVEDESEYGFYHVLDTPNNRLLSTAHDYLSRIRQNGLTIRASHTVLVKVDSNKDARFLLEKDVK